MMFATTMLSSIFFRIRYLHVRKTKSEVLLLNFKRLEDSYLEKAREKYSKRRSQINPLVDIKRLIKLNVLPIEIVLRSSEWLLLTYRVKALRHELNFH